MTDSFLKTNWVYWFCQSLGWGGVVGLGWMMNGIQRLSAVGSQPTQDNYFLPLTCVAGFFTTHFLRILIKKGKWLEMQRSALALRYALALVVITLALTFLGLTFFGESRNVENRLEAFTITLMVNSSLVGAWMAIYFLLHFHEAFHSARAERALLKEAYTRTQLDALRQQINPHFLFNALNTIRAFIPPSSHEAREAVTKLAEILRATLRSGQNPTTPLAEEMSVVRDYLRLEKLRFGDQLQIRESLAPGTLRAEIPPLLLLTIVENAIKHGVQHQEKQATIGISSHIADEEITLTVESPGGSLSEANSNSLGIGLRNAQKRLTLIFGEKTSVLLSTSDPSVTKCELVFPSRLHQSNPCQEVASE
jgi:LytS/YehU family sensor histidine kinase